jgi:plasmid segregation protein ParM
LSKLKVFGIDHGNGYLKLVSDDKKIVLPNIIARVSDFLGDELLAKKYDVCKYRSEKIDDETYVWGQDILKANKLQTSFTDEGRYDQKVYKLLSSFALAVLKEGNGIEEILLVTGVPSREKGTEVERELQKAFSGTHIINVDGIDRAVKVMEIKILAQPVGTIMYLFLDDDGGIQTENQGITDEYCGIVDIGFGTTDLNGVKELDIVHADTETIKSGMSVAYQKLVDYVNKQYPGANASLKTVEKQLLGDNPDCYCVSKRQAIDITEIKEEAFSQLAEDIINGINQRWTNRSKFDRIILTGGGASVLHKHFKSWEKDIELIPSESQIANAIGFYRYGKYKVQGQDI